MKDQAAYNRIGTGYDNTRRADPYLAGRMADLLGLRPGMRCLDLACGTGNYTVALASEELEWWGVDASSVMIEAAKDKSAQAESARVRWLLGDATRLPFPGDCFSATLCTLAIHHFDSLRPAFGEVARTLREGRPFVLFTSTPAQMADCWLAHYFPDALARSAEQMPPLEEVESALRDAGFTRIETEPYAVREDLEDMFFYSGKHRPEVYLDPNFRAGISTFRALTETSELETGLRRLKEDIESDAIARVVKKYDRDRGDYLFVIAT